MLSGINQLNKLCVSGYSLRCLEEYCYEGICNQRREIKKLAGLERLNKLRGKGTPEEIEDIRCLPGTTEINIMQEK